jgi:hypothetical protein
MFNYEEIISRLLVNLSRIFGIFHSQGHGISGSHTKIKSDNERGNYSIMKIGPKMQNTLTHWVSVFLLGCGSWIKLWPNTL